MKNNNKMKIQKWNEDTKMKWRSTTNITKTSLEVLPSKVTSLGVFVKSASNCKGYWKAMVSEDLDTFDDAPNVLSVSPWAVRWFDLTNDVNYIGCSGLPWLWRFSRKKSHQKKNYDYRSVIGITLISTIVLHMVAISTCNKDNGWCSKHSKRYWLFWRHCWYTKRRHLTT